MELHEKLYALSERIEKLKGEIKTEEATKQSFILPFFQYLGYDVFNPLEFVPECVADVGMKKGEKVDYCIMKDGKPFIAIEAKACFDTLDKHTSQIYRYFGATETKFAILTNGILYRFFSDLDEINKMDKKPFFEIDLLNLNDQAIQYLDKFVKSNIDVDNIMSTAEELKYLNLTKTYFKSILENPSDDFIRMILSNIYDGVKTQAIIDKFRPIIKKGISQHINDRLSAKFKETLDYNENEIPQEVEKETVKEPISKINTTIDELNGYAIVKSILRNEVPASRIKYKDTETYFGILLDGNTRKWICRIKLGVKSNTIIISDENKKEVSHSIDSLDDIYDYADELIKSLKKYL